MYDMNNMKQILVCYFWLFIAISVTVGYMFDRSRNIGWIDSESFTNFSLICFFCEFLYIFINKDLFLSFIENIV